MTFPIGEAERKFRREGTRPAGVSARERTMDTIDALSVDAERNDNLKKAKLENGFYNIIYGEKVAASKRLSVINPVTGKQLAAVPDVDRALLNKAISDARNAFSGWGAVPFERWCLLTASRDAMD